MEGNSEAVRLKVFVVPAGLIVDASSASSPWSRVLRGWPQRRTRPSYDAIGSQYGGPETGARLSRREKSRDPGRSEPKDLAPGEVVEAQWPAGLPYGRFVGRIPRAAGELFLTDQRLVFDPTEETARRPKGSSSGTWGIFAAERFLGLAADRGAARLDDIASVEETTGEHPLMRVVLNDGTEVTLSFRERGFSWPGQKRRKRIRLVRDDAVQQIAAALKARHQR